MPDCDGAGTVKRSYPTSEVRGAARRRYPTPLSVRPGAAGGLEGLPHALKREARGCGREDQLQAMAAQAQEGLEELSHVEGQEGWR